MKGSRKVIGETTLAKNIDRMFGAARKNVVNVEPMLKSTSNGHSICIEQTEYVTDVVSTGSAFHVDTWNINAGLASSFPQLCQIASLFEQYVFVQLEYEYRPMVFDQLSSSNNSMGVVGMLIQYDVTDQLLQSKLTSSNWEGAETSKPSEPMILRVDCGRRVTADNVLMEYYVRSGQQTTGSAQVAAGVYDLRLYDLGLLNIFTYGQQTGQTLGEIWVKYKVCFFKQIPVQPLIVGNPLSSIYYNNNYSCTTADTMGTLTTPMLAQIGSNVPIAFTGTNYIYLPSWLPYGSQWELEVHYTTNSTASITSFGINIEQPGLTASPNLYVQSGASAGLSSYFTISSGSTNIAINKQTFRVVDNPANPSLGYQIQVVCTLSQSAKCTLILRQLLDTYRT